MVRKSRLHRSDLRITDLKARIPTRSMMMSMKVPIELFNAITRLARQLDASKVEVTIALLNAGLDQWRKRRT